MQHFFLVVCTFIRIKKKKRKKTFFGEIIYLGITKTGIFDDTWGYGRNNFLLRCRIRKKVGYCFSKLILHVVTSILDDQ